MKIKKDVWREFGKYLLDVSKYIISILIIGYVLQVILAKGELVWGILFVAVVNAIILLVVGLILINIGGVE